MRNYCVEGYSVKGIKSWSARDGIGFTGNLYRGARKVASFIDRGDGSQMDIDYISDEEKKMFLGAVDLTEYADWTEGDAMVIATMCDSYEVRKKVVSHRNKSTIIKLKDSNYGVLDVVDFPYSEKLAKKLREIHKDNLDYILNEEYSVYPNK